MHCCLIFAIVIGSIAGVQHGYNIGVVNAPEEVIKDWLISNHPSYTKYTMSILWSTIVSIFCIGGLIGGVCVGVTGNAFGRKGALILNNIFVIIAAVLFIMSKLTNLYYLLIAARFVIGINCGLNAGLGPMYLSEISPTRWRGAIGSMYQLMITISILISQILGMRSIMGTDTLWPYLLALIIIPGVIQIICFLFIPESPKYYLDKKQNEEKALKALQDLNGKKADVSAQFQEMKNDVNDAKSLPKVSIGDLFKQKKLRTPLIIICGLMLAQQFSGINAVIFYSTNIFKSVNFSERTSQFATMGVGVVNVLTTIASVYFVDKVGRKSLLLIGFAGMFVSTVILFVLMYFLKVHTSFGYICIVLVYIYIISFASGVGSIPWLLGPELFNTAARPAALSVAVPANLLPNFIVGICFLPLQELMGPAVFIIFIVCQGISFVLIWIFVPETKNKPIDEITALFE